MKSFTATMLLIGTALGMPAPVPEPRSLGPPPHTNAKFQTHCSTAINDHRAQHNAPPVKWGKKHGDYAYKWVNTYQPSHGPYGENMYRIAVDPSYNPDWEQYTYDAFDWWMSFASEYDPSNLTEDTKWYTQLVWKKHSNYGCSWSTKPYYDPEDYYYYYYFYCEFDPPGNYAGGYASNVE